MFWSMHSGIVAAIAVVFARYVGFFIPTADVRSVAIGAIILRTFRDGPTFSDNDVQFVQVVAALTAQALRNAHRYERLALRQEETGEQNRRMELERVALLAFLRRLMEGFGQREGAWAEGLLPRASADELDRLVGVALAVIQEEAKGR